MRRGGCHWLASLPATFMTAVVVAYLCVAPEGFKMEYETSVTIGVVAAALALRLFLAKSGWFRTQVPLQLNVGE